MSTLIAELRRSWAVFDEAKIATCGRRLGRFDVVV
jgi:hypothetical protein